MKNENSVAARRLMPMNRPPSIVAAERLVPGISASVWIRPTFSASEGRTSSTVAMRSVCRRRSAHRMITPPITSASATGTGANSLA